MENEEKYQRLTLPKIAEIRKNLNEQSRVVLRILIRDDDFINELFWEQNPLAKSVTDLVEVLISAETINLAASEIIEAFFSQPMPE